jgi:hypothetical protein
MDGHTSQASTDVTEDLKLDDNIEAVKDRPVRQNNETAENFPDGVVIGIPFRVLVL